MRRLGYAFLTVICLIAGAYVALVLFGRTLPDAPQSGTGPGRVTTMTSTTTTSSSHRLGGAGGPLLAVPVAGVARSSISDSWGDPRENGLRSHHGTDIMAPGGTPVSAAAPGTVEKLWNSAAGGTTIYIRSPNRDWTYYYAHLSGYAPGLHEGQVVKTGDLLGFVGDTGDAGAGNFHLHFGLTRTTPDQHWYQGEDVDPYPYLAGKPSSR
ncbi:M23 family metallopeptidase [Sphingomonas oligophenolica]|uniref:M23 family metallopeptidase n=1 Tax=Sphingomonas oligophenolica TaxID=301154 RepID=UPI003CD0BECB